MAYPKGTRFNQWLLSKETQRGIERFCVKRWIYFPDDSKKLERLPVKQYQLIRDNELELRQLVIRLNEQTPIEERTRTAVEIKHAYISPKFLDDYRDYLLVQIPSQRQAQTEYFNLVTYFLNFFITKLKMPNPLEWHLAHKTAWATYLLSEEVPTSVSSKKNIIAAANRFMAFLHEHRPGEVPPLKFKPLSKAKFKEIQATRQMRGEARVPKFINDADFKKILKSIPSDIKPMTMLAYHFGLRRSETLALKTTDVKKGYLSVERQLLALNTVGPLKGREFRQVPHWFSSPLQAHTWISEVQPIHPDTLTDRWTDLMNTLKLEYTFHDLRHTWITKAMRKQAPRDVQLAAGHKNIETTMRYLHDDRELEDEQFIPGEAS